MPYQVQVSGGQVVEFPDSVSQEEAQKILADQIQPTGEDIAGAMQDPSYTPSVDDYLKYEEYAKNKQVDWIDTIAKSVDAAATMIGGAVAEGAQGAAVNPLNYIEGAAQGTRQLYGLVAQSQDPSSPLFKFKDLVAGTGTPESRYQQFLEARDFANTTARLERGEQGIVVPPEYTNPEYVQGVSMILDPTLFVPGVGEVLGTGKLATKAVGRGAKLAGEAIAGAARPLERITGAAERMTAEALGMTPEGLRSTAATAGIAGALGIAPEAATLAAIPAGIRTTREAGEALARAGENLMTQPSRIGPLEAIGAAPGANMRQRLLGVVGQYGGDAALDAALRATAGGLEGAAIGAGLGYLSGGEEGAAAGLGSGAVQGAAGALGGRAYQKLTGQAAKEARAGDLSRFIDAQQDPTTKALFERVRDTHGVDAASALMDVGGLVKGTLGDIDINYLSNADFVDKHKGIARGVQLEVGDRPTLDINADIIGKGQGDTPLYTLSHELFHALEKSKQLSGAATEIKDALVGRWVQEGDTIRKLADGALTDAEIEARFNEYRDKLAAGNKQRADELAKFDTINKKADYIASEIAAEHFSRLLAGQKPDALLKGFSGLTRQLMDAALTQNAIKSIANAAASIERTFGVKPTDSVLFPDLKQASPQLNAMLRDLVRARRRLDEKILLDSDHGGRVLKPEDAVNPLAARELVDLGVAERLPDGSVRNLSDEEIRARDDRDMTSLRAITDKLPGARLVDGEISGRFSPEQLSAIEQSQTISSRMKDKIRAVNLAIENGNSLFVTYYAALRRVRNRLTGKESPKYSSGIKVSEREFVPYSFQITKADNPLVRAIDITKVRNELTKLLKKDGSIGGLWANTDGFMADLAKYFTNLDQKEGALRSAEIFGVDKAKFLGDFINSSEKSGGKFIRSFRLDRVGSMSPMDFKAKFSEEAYQLSKQRWMPSEKIGDKSVTNSDEGYRIISGAKHKLYGPDGKLLGIFDTQTQAERKADATQARLQPEDRQQQYQARDEGRQTAEAGRGYRLERGPQGQGEGGQEPGAVRQAGDVGAQRFMPSDTDYLSAVQQGDTQAAQRMVDEAAKAAGLGESRLNNAGNPEVMYHGSGWSAHNVFERGKSPSGGSKPYPGYGLDDIGFWFTSSKNQATEYGSVLKQEGGKRPPERLYNVFLDIKNPLEFADQNDFNDWIDSYARIYAVDETSKSLMKGGRRLVGAVNVNMLLERLKMGKKDGIIIWKGNGDKRFGLKPDESYPTWAIVFDPSQIKSADPITRDDAGNVIPLSQRFKATSEDIRYMPAGDMASGRSVKDHREAMDLFEKGYRIYGALYDGMEDPVRLKKATEIERFDPENLWAVPPRRVAAAIAIRNMPADMMPQPDSSMPGAYSFQGGYRALPGKTKGSLRLYGPAGSLIGIAASLDEAQRILRRKSK